jgi:catechol 2,3-dioxygenase
VHVAGIRQERALEAVRIRGYPDGRPSQERKTAGMHNEAIHPAVRVGHVHLRVADLDRALEFYRDALGFRVTADARRHGLDMVLLAAGDYHHHIGLNSWDSAGTEPPPPGHTGLYHVAFLYPDRRELGGAVRRLLDHGYPIDHSTDHGGTVSVYLDDPDGNGVELYYDRPRADWFDADGRPTLKNERVDYHELLPNPTTTGA